MIINDHWTVDLDHLGMKPAGEELSRAILRCTPPFAIGVFGKWGAGKTSLMRYAMARLGGEPLGVTLRSTPDAPILELPFELQQEWNRLRANKAVTRFIHDEYKEATGSRRMNNARDCLVLPIWYSPWQHQGAENPIVPLLHELAAQASTWARSKAKAKKLAVTAVESGIDLLFGLAGSAAKLAQLPNGGIAQAPSTARANLARYEAHHFETRSEVQRFNLLFEAAIARLLGDSVDEPRKLNKGGHQFRRLVIFIDDLDRCEEDQIVRLLESIKLYLRTRYCVFVLGLDDGAVRRAVRRKWSGRTREEAQDYLDKLFQAGIYVPLGNATKFDEYVAGLLRGWGLNQAGRAADQLRADILALCERNPRRVKTFVNGLVLDWRARGNSPASLPDSDALLGHYLRTYHPEVSRLLQHDPELADELHTVLVQHKHDLPPGAGPVARFFHQRFRHVFTQELSDPGRPEVDASADELVARLDRFRTDREFVRRLKQRADETGGLDSFRAALGD